ncbi:MAG: hypothetical protein ABI451_07400 [Dokdonella sp.]
MSQSVLPQLVIRVGLTGHRPNRLKVAAEHVATQIDAVLEKLDQAASKVATTQPKHYRDAPALRRYTCGLAQGSDEIGADVALERGWQLQSVLAFDPQRFVEIATEGCDDAEAARYREHFDRLRKHSASVLEIRGPENGGLHRDAYELVGEITLEQSDVLIGVWDGEPARGLGGAAHLIRLARERRLPVVWIHASQPDVAPRVFLPGTDESSNLASIGDWLHDSLCLNPTPEHVPGSHPHAHDRDAQQRWRDFQGEDASRSSRFPPLFQMLLVLGGKRWPSWRLLASSSHASWHSNWQRFHDAVATTDAPLAGAMDASLWQPFHRADHLAEIYGRAYRGTYVLIYLLAGLATTAGLMGTFFHHEKALFVSIELVMILLMLAMTILGRRRCWHERWLEYRAVAEQLRQARMGIWCGQSLEPSDADGDSSHAGASWASWYVRACVRQLPMINAVATPTFVRTAIATINELEVQPQLDFNERTSKNQARVHERLESTESILLWLLIAGCVVFLALYVPQMWHLTEAQSEHLRDAMTFIGALFPALGAALLGVRSQGDFSAYAERTADTAAQLKPVMQRAARLAGADSNPGFQDLLEVSDQTTDALANDVFAWRMVYRRKVLTAST